MIDHFPERKRIHFIHPFSSGQWLIESVHQFKSGTAGRHQLNIGHLIRNQFQTQADIPYALCFIDDDGLFLPKYCSNRVDELCWNRSCTSFSSPFNHSISCVLEKTFLSKVVLPTGRAPMMMMMALPLPSLFLMKSSSVLVTT